MPTENEDTRMIELAKSFEKKYVRLRSISDSHSAVG